jgi:hypothetical protein
MDNYDYPNSKPEDFTEFYGPDAFETWNWDNNCQFCGRIEAAIDPKLKVWGYYQENGSQRVKGFCSLQCKRKYFADLYTV